MSSLLAASERVSSLLGNGNTKHYRIVNGTAYSAGMTMKDGTEDTRATPDEIVAILEKYRDRETEVRVFYGDALTGRSWLGENDIVGTIGRSTGRIKIPLLVPTAGHGGPGLLDHCIVRIDTRTRTLWQHPTFHVPPIEIRTGDRLDLAYEVFVNDELYARFHRRFEAERWKRVVSGDVFPDRNKEPGAYGLDHED